MRKKIPSFQSTKRILKLKILAKQKENIRKKLSVTVGELRLKAKKLARVAKQKEDIRKKLAVTASELKELYATIGKKVHDRTKDLEKAKIATRNVLEGLQIEKRRLAEAKAKDEAILESIGDGLIAVDNDRKIMLVNKVAANILGWPPAELIGKIITELPLEDDAGNLISLNKRPTTMAFTSGEVSKVTYNFLRKDKTRFPIEITATPIKFKDKTIGLIEVIRDVTKEKEIDKAKTEFVSLASHQLRTPLTAISWYTEMILKNDVGKVVPEQKKYLEKIYQGNKRMIDLVNTLLDVSRIELGTFHAEPKQTDIIELAQSVCDELRAKIEEKKLLIVQKFDKLVPIVLIDSKLLRMVFQNLLTNSVEYTPPKGKVEFSIFMNDKKHLEIRISDTGYGIPKDQQNQIFTKLFRADNVRKKDTEGTGLGLYITKSVVENMGGTIRFESEENKGTTFYTTLPLNTSEPENEQVAH